MASYDNRPLIQEEERHKPFCSIKGLVALSFVLVGLAGGLGYYIGRHQSSVPIPTPGSSVNQCFPPGSKQAECPFKVVDDLIGHHDQTLSGIPYLKGSKIDRASSQSTFGRRIEYEVITVDDMQLATNFYVQLFGAVEIDFCSNSNHPSCLDGGGVAYRGKNYHDAFFSHEISLKETVPDITDGANYEARSRFFVLGNGVIHLLQFAVHTTSNSSYFDLREPKTSPCWVGAGHICFWIDEDIDMNDFIAETENNAKFMNMPNVAWNRPVPQQTRADRAKVNKNQYSNKVPDDSAFGGLEWSYFKGPVGEQLEAYKMTKTMKKGIGRAYCDRGAVSSAFTDYRFPEATPITARMYGMFQYGYRTNDLNAAVGFYTEVMHGDLITYPTHGLDIRGDDAHWMILANETIEAYELAASDTNLTRRQAMRKLGVANISTHGTNRLDHRFILFDNFVVEALIYTDGLTFGGKGFNPSWNHSTSPAYIGSVGAAWGIDSTGNMKDALADLTDRAKQRGFPDVYIPDVSKVASFPSDHPFSGFEFSYGKGQAGEMMAFVKFSGSFEAKLEAAVKAAKGVSTRFNSTDVFKNGAMKKFCDSLG